MINYYKVIELSPTAKPDEIRKAISKELRNWTKRTNDARLERRQEAERMVKYLEEAESILLDVTKRAEYDKQLQAAPAEERSIDDLDLSGKEDLVQEGWNLLIEGNIPDALYVATRATEQQGNNAEAWALLAQAKYRWGDTEDAIYEYKRAIKLKPNVASYYFDLGSVYESTERWNDALQQYQRASQIDPSTIMYQAAIGVLFLKNDKFEEAIKILEACKNEDPDNKTYGWFLAIAYSQTAYHGWTFVPEDEEIDSGWYATSIEHINSAQELLEKALSLEFDDDELRIEIENQKKEIERNLKRKFTPALGNLGIIVAIIYIVIGISSLSNGEIFPLFWFTGGGILFFIGSMTPQYIVNRDLIKYLQHGSVLEKAMNVARKIGEAKAGWMLIIGVFIALPIIASYKVFKNYIQDYGRVSKSQEKNQLEPSSVLEEKSELPEEKLTVPEENKLIKVSSTNSVNLPKFSKNNIALILRIFKNNFSNTKTIVPIFVGIALLIVAGIVVYQKTNTRNFGDSSTLAGKEQARSMQPKTTLSQHSEPISIKNLFILTNKDSLEKKKYSSDKIKYPTKPLYVNAEYSGELKNQKISIQLFKNNNAYFRNGLFAQEVNSGNAWFTIEQILEPGDWVVELYDGNNLLKKKNFSIVDIKNDGQVFAGQLAQQNEHVTLQNDIANKKINTNISEDIKIADAYQESNIPPEVVEFNNSAFKDSNSQKMLAENTITIEEPIKKVGKTAINKQLQKSNSLEIFAAPKDNF
jgi:tetratricopeptide (TPR) repeat protein